MLTDSPIIVSPPADLEQTTQLYLDPWQWPAVDPDDRRNTATIAETGSVAHEFAEPTLPILEAVLDGLRRLADPP